LLFFTILGEYSIKEYIYRYSLIIAITCITRDCSRDEHIMAIPTEPMGPLGILWEC